MEKYFFSYGAPTKNAPLWISVSYNFPRGGQAGVLPDFDQLLVGENLYPIWCFIQCLHCGCDYTPHYLPYDTR